MNKLFWSIAFMGIILSFQTFAQKKEEAVSTELSGCKGNPYRITPSGDEANTQEIHDASNNDNAIEWRMEYSDNVLTLTWYDVEENCCPEYEKSWIIREDDNHLVFQYDMGFGECDCICLFDIVSKYDGIEPGHYTVTFKDAWSEIYTTEIDLENGADFKLSTRPGGSGITQMANRGGIMRYDNGVLYIEEEGHYNLKIFDASGIMVANLNLEAASEVSVMQLAKGSYIAKIEKVGKFKSFRFMR